MRRSWSQVPGAALVVGAALASTGCSSAIEPGTFENLRLEALTSTSLTGSVAFLVTPHPVVRVTTANGQPVADVSVEFVLAAGGSVKQRTVFSNGDGLASVGHWRLGPVAGVQLLTVRIPNGASVEFTALATPGPVAQLIAITGNLQSIAVGENVKQPLRVRAADSYNNDVPSVPVTFTALNNPGSTTQVTADPLGVAVVYNFIVSSTTPGHHRVRASSGEASTVFTITVCRTSCRNDELLFLHGFTLIRANVAGETISVTEPGAWWVQPAWSSTGRIAFVKVEDYDLADLYIGNADGSNERKIGRMQQPSWSPDGTSLAVSSGDCYLTCDILLLRFQGDSLVQTTTLATKAYSPAWSPDGKKIAFISYSPDSSLSRLETMNVDGTGRDFVTPVETAALVRPSWSSDGQRIAYARCLTRCDVYVAKVDGSSNDLLVQGGTDPAWSPDGTWIAFTSNSPSFENSYISYVAADGQTPPVALSHAGYWPVWKNTPPLNR